MISTNDGGYSKRMQRDFYEWVGQILRDVNVISMREGATLRECNVISTNGVRMEWEA